MHIYRLALLQFTSTEAHNASAEAHNAESLQRYDQQDHLRHASRAQAVQAARPRRWRLHKGQHGCLACQMWLAGWHQLVAGRRQHARYPAPQIVHPWPALHSCSKVLRTHKPASSTKKKPGGGSRVYSIVAKKKWQRL